MASTIEKMLALLEKIFCTNFLDIFQYIVYLYVRKLVIYYTYSSLMKVYFKKREFAYKV